MINRPNTSKRKRRRRCSNADIWTAAAVLLSIICIIEKVSSFSNHLQPSSINDRSSTIPDIRWHTATILQQQSGSSSTSSSSDNTLVSKASIKGAIATSISTNEQISQLEKHAQHTKQNRSKQYNKSKKYKSSKYRGKKGKHKKSRNYYHTSKNQNKKRKIRHLYSQAKSYEKQGKWKEATKLLYDILSIEPNDSHSYLALAKLQSRRDRGLIVGGGSSGGVGEGREVKEGEIEDSSTQQHDLDISLVQTKSTTTTKQQKPQYKNARQIFQAGTTNCPKSIHLWHAWGMYELSLSNPHKASELFTKALEIDPYNGYVNHALGSLELQYNNNSKRGEECYLKGLQQQPSAALVCSLGELYIKNNTPDKAQSLYTKYIPKIYNEREKIEVYLAASSLEERVYNNIDKASQLLKEALEPAGGGKDSGGTIVHDSRAYVALARLGTSNGLVNDTTVKKRLKEICIKQLKHHKHTNKSLRRFPVKDGRLFNAWAKLESKTNLQEARKILGRGMKMYPRDYTLLQAAGNIEERLGHVEKARELYGASLSSEINVPTLISYGLLELRSPEGGEDNDSSRDGQEKEKRGQDPNITMVRKLFNEALLIDPKHGPLYNAYGNLELKEGNTNRAKELYEAGINANCTDASSVYHGLAKLHLKLGDVDTARSVLQRGLALFDTGDGSGGSNAIDDMKNNAKGGKTPEKKKQQQLRQHHSAQQQNENVAFLAHTLAMIELKFNNNPTVAKSVLNQGLYHSPNSPQLLLAMALSESRMNNESAARTWFEKSLRSDQCHAQAWQAFGVMEMKYGNFRTAKTLFECGIKNVPGHGALWQAYGKSVP